MEHNQRILETLFVDSVPQNTPLSPQYMKEMRQKKKKVYEKQFSKLISDSE